MGRLKPNLAAGAGETFLSRIVRTFNGAGVDDVVIVVGHEAAEVVSEFGRSGLPARFAFNAAYEQGQLSSLLAGLAVVDRPGVEAALVTLVDVPFVSVATVRAVVERYQETHAMVVRPTRGADHGHPLLIRRELFDVIRRADPTLGAKPLVRAYATGEGDVAIEDRGAFTDIDTEPEYEAALATFGRA